MSVGKLGSNTREWVECRKKGNDNSIGKKLSEMTLEELWQLFPIILVELFSNQFCEVVDPIVKITFAPFMVIPMALGFRKMCHLFDKKKESK